MINLLREAELQQQREREYPASAQRLADQAGLSPTPTTTLQWLPIGPQSALSEWNGSYRASVRDQFGNDFVTQGDIGIGRLEARWP
jgi:hypothetical protein